MDSKFWSDDEVRTKAEEWETLMVGHANMPAADYIEAAMIEVRDSLLARIAELEDALSLVNKALDALGEHNAQLKAERDLWLQQVDEDTVSINRLSVERDAANARVAELEAAPGMPQPDWSTAPEWAMWHTIDKDGKARWWETKPVLNDKYSWWLYDWEADKLNYRHYRHYRHKPVQYTPEENGIDWRQTLQARPIAPSEVTNE